MGLFPPGCGERLLAGYGLGEANDAPGSGALTGC